MLKNFIIVIFQAALLYGLFRIGVFIQQMFDLFIPGSIIGMLLFFGLLKFFPAVENFFKIGASFVLAHLPIFFTPATVGIMIYFDLFKGKGMLLIVITVISTLIVLIGSALTTRLVIHVKEKVKG